MIHFKIIFTFLLLAFLLSCSSSTKEETQSVVSATDRSMAIDTSSKEIALTQTNKEEELDCVFDTSTYKFTTEVIHRYDPRLKYIWDDKEKQAIVPLRGADTLILHIGGCNHFSYWAEYKTESSFFSNEKYLMDKAVWIAENFFDNGFDEGFVKFITTKQYTLERNDSFLKSYSIKTDSTIQENEIYDGISVEKMGDRLVLGLHGYVN